MLVRMTKGSISREVEDYRVQEYLDKGFSFVDGLDIDENSDDGFSKKELWDMLFDERNQWGKGYDRLNELLTEANRKIEELEGIARAYERPLEEYTVEGLKRFAELNGIDLGRATSKKTILEKILVQAASKENETTNVNGGEADGAEGNT